MKRFISFFLAIVLALSVLQAFGAVTLFAEEDTGEYTGYVYDIAKSNVSDSMFIYKTNNSTYTADYKMSIVVKNMGTDDVSITYSPRKSSGWLYYLTSSSKEFIITISPGETQLVEIPFPEDNSNAFFLIYIRGYKGASDIRLAFNIQSLTCSGTMTAEAETVTLTPMNKKTVALDGTYMTTEYAAIGYSYNLAVTPGSVSPFISAAKGVGVKDGYMTVTIKNLGENKFSFIYSPRHDGWAYILDVEKTIVINPGTAIQFVVPAVSTDFFLCYFYSSTDSVINFACNLSTLSKSTLTKDASIVPLKADWVYNYSTSGDLDIVFGDYDYSAQGDYALITDRVNQVSSIAQDIKSLLPENTKKQYYVSAQVRLTETPVVPIECDLVIDQATTWPQSDWKILSTEWTRISAILTIDSSLSRAKFAIQTLYTKDPATGEAWTGSVSSDRQAAKEDIEIDSIYIIPVDDADNNLTVNPGLDSDTLTSINGWGKNGSCTVLSSNGLNVAPSGDYAILSGRNTRCASIAQNVLSKLPENSKKDYYLSAQVRLTEESETPVKCNLVMDQANSWPQSGFTVLTTEWQHISATVSLDSTKTKALFCIQTLYTVNPETQEAWATGTGLDAQAAKVDIEIDTICLIPIDDKDTNMFENGDLNGSITGTVPGWVSNAKCNIVSSNGKTLQFDTPGEAQTDGSILYANGCVPYSDTNIIYTGRWKQKNDMMQGSFEGYSELNFTGTSISVYGYGNVWVSVDGGTEKGYTLNGLQQLAYGLAEGNHNVRVIAKYQLAFPEIRGYVIDYNARTLVPADTPVIEFIGDSITEGYIVGNNSYLNSYAYLTGKALGWRFNTIAYGGIAATVGRGSDTIGIAARYLKQSELNGADDTVDYDFTNDHVDYTVINIGTNDGSPATAEAITAFKTGYKALIDNVYAKHPDCKIFVMIPFNGNCKALIEEVVADYDGITLINSNEWPMTYETDKDKLHPDYACHVAASQKLYDIIAQEYASFTAANVEAGSSLSVNFYAELLNADNVTVRFTRNGESVIAQPVWNEQYSKYMFTYAGINPQCMTDSITAELIIDEKVCASKTYSVKENCENLYSDNAGDTKLKTLLASILNFGAAAQSYVGYSTEALATDSTVDFSGLDISKPEKIANTVLSSATSADNKAVGAGLLFENILKIYFKLKVEDGATIYLNGAEVTGTVKNGYTYVYTDGIASTDFDTAYIIEIKVDDTTVHKVQYSVNTYISNKWETEDSKLNTLVKAIAAYGAASEAYTEE